MNKINSTKAVFSMAGGLALGLAIAASADAGDAGGPFFTTTLTGIFRPFVDDSGLVQSAPSTQPAFSTAGGSIVPTGAPLDGTNVFFSTAFGTNGQACATCHQAGQGFTVSPEVIQDKFDDSGGTDALFRFNSTANNPHVTAATADNYSLILNLGVMRIGKTFAPGSNFTAVAADPATIDRFAAPDVFPLTTDPQQPSGAKTLSLFRRPLVNTNVRLDSSVLWDGRASVGNMRAQVLGAAKALLLAPNPSNADADQVAAFMLGVFTDQVFDTAAGTDAGDNCTFTLPGQQCGAGLTRANGATSGVQGLLALALGMNAPCTSFLQSPCVPNVPGYDVFDAWAHLPNERGTNAARASVARGQAIFNTAVLHMPPDLQAQLGTEGHCTTCHATRNIGNNPDSTFFARVGTDSVQIVSDLVSAGHTELAPLLERVRMLPQYCLRPVSDVSPGACGTHPTDVVTTDPGRAMVSGNIQDVGKFKPPILRGLTVRSPYFHAGVADGIPALVQFYNARFDIGLTPRQVVDLTSFLEAQ
ncbi:MAG TPA: hypothetical protein VFP36_04380 [Usitatibacter sp.]|nr:hypothetical protein [Usitatibacter sp.]